MHPTLYGHAHLENLLREVERGPTCQVVRQLYGAGWGDPLQGQGLLLLCRERVRRDDGRGDDALGVVVRSEEVVHKLIGSVGHLGGDRQLGARALVGDRPYIVNRKAW